MEKYAVAIFSFVAVMAVSVFFMDSFSPEITVNAIRQISPKVSVGMGASSYVPQSKTAQSGLIIMNGMTYSTTTMQGIVSIQGKPISVDILKQNGVILSNGRLITPNKKNVQIKDVQLRRKPIKLTFSGKK